MFTTRRALIFFVGLSCVLLALVLVLLFGKDVTKHSLYGMGSVSFSDVNEDDFEITVTRSGKGDGIRESLIAKLTTGSVPSEGTDPIEIEETLSEPEELVEGNDSTHKLLLGDGDISSSPQKGHVFVCNQYFGDASSVRSGEWIEDPYWFPEEKVLVDGSVRWQNDISITLSEGARIVRTNGLPNHTTGEFPIRTHDDAYVYDTHSNGILSQSTTVQFPLNPIQASVPRCLPMGMIGVGLNGVALFSALDARGKDAPAHEMQDHCAGHPETNGTYHYHNESECLVNAFYEGAESTLLGYALDGFGIFSSIENGKKLTNDDLDSCHGHEHSIPWNGVMAATYHYHMTNEYPYSLGCFMGEPATSNTSSPVGLVPSLPATPESVVLESGQ